MSQSHLVIDFPIKVTANAKALSEELPALMPDFAKVQDDLGTVHFSRFMVEGEEKLLFLSDIDGDVAPHIEQLVERADRCSTASSSTSTTPRPHAWQPPQKVVKWLRHHVREPLDTYFAYEDASVQDIKESASEAGSRATPCRAPC